MPHLLDHGASLDREALCVDDGEGRLSYGEVQDATRAIARAAWACGLARGDTVAIIALNHRNTFLAGIGACRAGLVPLSLNVLSNAVEAAGLVSGNQVRWIFFHSALQGLVDAILDRCEDVRGAVCIDRPVPGYAFLGDWMAGTGAADAAHDPSEIFCLFTSGGTTGVPKGVLTRKRGFDVMAATFLTVMPHHGKPRVLSAVPISHGAGALARSFLAVGAANIVLPRPDPELIMRTIERERITTLFLPPTLIYAMLAHPDVRNYDYSSLQYFLYAAAPMAPSKLREAIEVFGPVMCQSYGQAEAPIICTYFSPEAHVRAVVTNDEKRLLSCGQPTPFTTVAVMNDEGALLPDGEVGEIVVKSDLVMAGYNNNDEATREVSAFGWHHTGDLGYRDAEGFYYIVDRKRDMIISGGFNVFPSEVEKAVLSFPAVQDCCVIGIPDDKWGEAVCAVVETKQGSSVDIDALIAHVKSVAGSLVAPKVVEVWETLPRNTIGKVLRREVRDRFWAETQRKI